MAELGMASTKLWCPRNCVIEGSCKGPTTAHRLLLLNRVPHWRESREHGRRPLGGGVPAYREIAAWMMGAYSGISWAIKMCLTRR